MFEGWFLFAKIKTSEIIMNIGHTFSNELQYLLAIGAIPNKLDLWTVNIPNVNKRIDEYINAFTFGLSKYRIKKPDPIITRTAEKVIS